MTFGRWLLIHSFSIFLLAMFLLGYIYREELQLSEAYDQLLNIDSSSTVSDDTTAKEPASTSESKPIQQQSVEVPDNKTVSAPLTTATEPETNAAVLETRPTLSKSVIKQDELLFKARKAFWDKDYESAISHYKALIYQHPNNPDYHGELGNIYYALNDYLNAADQYYSAAIILLDQNKYEQARQLVSPVTAMNRELGERLKQRFLQ